MNSMVMEREEAPSALRSPISVRLSATMATIVVDTPIMVRARTMPVMMASRERSMPSTPESDVVRRLTAWALTAGTRVSMVSARAWRAPASMAMEYSAIEGVKLAPVKADMSGAAMYM